MPADSLVSVSMTTGIAGERIVITGATGYIGSALVSTLRELNEVHLLVRDPAVAGSLHDLPREQMHAILDEPGSIAALFERIAPNLVFHLATQYERRDDSEKIGSMVDANVRFGALVLDAASRLPDCPVVVAGSHFQFAGAPGRSASFYASTKNALCDIAEYLREARGLRWIQPVIFDAYGPGDTRPKLVNILIDRISSGQPVSLPEPQPLHHFVYIDDVIGALIASARELRSSDSASGSSVFLTSNELVPPSTVLDTVASVLGVDPVVSTEHFEMPPTSIMVPFEGPRPEGWRPTVSLSEGVEKILSHNETAVRV